MKLITAVDNVKPQQLVEGMNAEMFYVGTTGKVYRIKEGKPVASELDDVDVFADIEQMIDPYEAAFI